MTERRRSGNEQVRRKQEAQEALQVRGRVWKGSEHDEEVPEYVRTKKPAGVTRRAMKLYVFELGIGNIFRTL